MNINPRSDRTECETENYKELKNDSDDDDTSVSSTKKFRVTTEPLLICAKLITILHRLWATQYIFEELSRKNHLVTNGTNLCESTNATTHELYAKVSAETSEWVLYLNLAG